MEFSTALKRPFSDLKTFIIGSALSILPIINFFAFGYILEAAKLTLKKKNTLPEWNNWGNLFVKGLLSVLIGFIYMIPGMIAMIYGGLGFFYFTGGGELSLSLFTGPRVIGSLLFASLFFLLALYLIPSATLTFLTQRRFGAAFTFSTVFGKAFTGRYFLAWIVSSFVALVISFLALLIPFVGVGIGSFVVMMIAYTLLAEAYRS
ncbi:MAG TPA: DUF4013 domain-containing protein [Candidatus Nanoarchaeia archaeon]|nr:DUF4013 domain-containing protein [Candidatus Nanoarchaeia archaeon]